MNNGYILFYDSGIGGLSTLSKTIKVLQKERLLDIADNKNCPYGNKSSEEIEKLVQENLSYLLKCYNIKMVVFACNTITACCVNHLRDKYNLEIVGTEPAILPALRNSESKEILCILTNATSKQEKYKKLVDGADGVIHSLAFDNLASDIESHILEKEKIDLNKYVVKIKNVLRRYPKIDGLVLGCTHYCLVSRFFKTSLNISVYDGNLGVARRAETLLIRNNKLSNIDFKGRVTFILTKNNKTTQKQYKHILKFVDKC